MDEETRIRGVNWISGAGSLFRPSGGLTYHLRARLHEKSWRPFRDDIAAFLASWKIPKNDLILIGPSGGYTLPGPWLNDFQSVFAYDADPLAGFFFRRRHPKVKARFQVENVFWRNGQLSTKPLQAILQRHPHAALLFSNVLGQVLLEGKATETQWQFFLNDLSGILKGRRWASYHDLFSITHVAKSQHLETLVKFRQMNSTAAFTKGEVTDHLLFGQRWPEEPRREILGWSLTRDSLHLVEALHHFF